jgi:hypothetical protein
MLRKERPGGVADTEPLAAGQEEKIGDVPTLATSYLVK